MKRCDYALLEKINDNKILRGCRRKAKNYDKYDYKIKITNSTCSRGNSQSVNFTLADNIFDLYTFMIFYVFGNDIYFSLSNNPYTEGTFTISNNPNPTCPILKFCKISNTRQAKKFNDKNGFYDYEYFGVNPINSLVVYRMIPISANKQ